MYSGTVGACLQALTYRIPAIAFSCDSNFEVMEEQLENVFQYIDENKLLSSEYLLNINFPVDNDVKGICLTNIYYRKENTYYVKTDENMYYALRDLDDRNCQQKDSDAYAVYHNLISITKIRKKLD